VLSILLIVISLQHNFGERFRKEELIICKVDVSTRHCDNIISRVKAAHTLSQQKPTFNLSGRTELPFNSERGELENGWG
jgi:hypothetical protein